jgi:omega-amidase
MGKLTISLLQMNIALGNTVVNTNAAERQIAEAARRGSQLVVLPELWSTEARELGTALNAGLFTQLSAWATNNKISIIGSILEKRGLEVANTAAFIAPNGRMLGVYRKMHLFRLMREDVYLQPGGAPLLLDLPWGATGIAICYDLRFPEMFRRYAVDGAKMMIVSAEWPLERIEHWRALLVARAIENQCYMVACNAVGETGDTVYGGHSMIVDPWGKIVAEAGESPIILTAQIETDVVGEVRKRIPVFEDRREDIYG